jgi:hypothetical protein
MPLQAMSMWLDYSENDCAMWLHLPSDDNAARKSAHFAGKNDDVIFGNPAQSCSSCLFLPSGMACQTVLCGKIGEMAHLTPKRRLSSTMNDSP